MSSLSRAGFLIPASTDFADETLYFDNNITLLEAELPSIISASLPGSGSYVGQVRTIALPDNGPIQPAYPFATYVWSGSAWVYIGSFGNKQSQLQQLGTSGVFPNAPQASGTELFSPVAITGTIQVSPNQIIKFDIESIITSTSNSPGGSGNLTGNINIFIDPNSATPPSTTTPGAVRLKVPVNLSDSDFTAQTYTRFVPISGETFYDPNASTSATLGYSIYFSAIQNANSNGAFLSGVASYNLNSIVGIIESIGLQ
jgi:hypothetical protein